MNARGFTLLELLLVILITGIMAAVVAPIIREPIKAYFDQTGRAALVDAAEMALRRMERDVHRALPYSLRNGAPDRIELVRVRDVARYRQNGGPGSQRLSFNNADDEFNVLGNFPSITAPYTLGTDHPDERLVIFNLGAAPYDIYNGDAVVTPATTTITITGDGNEQHVNLDTGHEFEDSSPSHRIYIAETTVSYACNAGGLYRWSGYGYMPAQPAAATVAGNGVLMTDNVTNCRFDYDPGSATQPGLMTMELTVSNDAGESVTLLHLVHVPNAI